MNAVGVYCTNLAFFVFLLFPSYGCIELTEAVFGVILHCLMFCCLYQFSIAAIKNKASFLLHTDASSPCFCI